MDEFFGLARSVASYAEGFLMLMLKSIQIVLGSVYKAS